MSTTSQRPFEPTWDSLRTYQCPDWFREAKFGIYAHWGPYSACDAAGNTDWFSHHMYLQDSKERRYQEENHGSLKEFGYKDHIPRFTGEKFDADEWVDLCVKSGAKFAGPVAEHADGFAMWDSKVTKWNAARMGPNRDILAEMEKAVRKRGLKFVTSFHHHWKWGWYPTMDENTDCSDPACEGLYGPALPSTAFDRPPVPTPTAAFSQEWLDKIIEVVDGYRPDLLWFDNRMEIIPERYRKQMAAHFYNSGNDLVMTFKRPDMVLGSGTVDLERCRKPDIYPEPWLTDTSVAENTWSHSSDIKYYTVERLIHDLVDIVSKNGCLLLNLAPAADGTIPDEQKDQLLGIGEWLKVNGEAIYGSRPWFIYGEGPTETPVGHLSDVGFAGFSSEDVRFTTQGETLYATVFGWPAEGEPVKIKTLSQNAWNEDIQSIELLGHDGDLTWTRDADALKIQVPAVPIGKHAFVFKTSIG